VLVDIVGRPIAFARGGRFKTACRAEAETGFGHLAQAVEPRFSLAELVLPPAQSRQVAEILAAMGADPTDSQGALRFSLGYGNTDDDVAYAVDAIETVVDKLRAMSPLSRPQQAKVR